MWGTGIFLTWIVMKMQNGGRNFGFYPEQSFINLLVIYKYSKKKLVPSTFSLGTGSSYVFIFILWSKILGTSLKHPAEPGPQIFWHCSHVANSLDPFKAAVMDKLTWIKNVVHKDILKKIFVTYAKKFVQSHGMKWKSKFLRFMRVYPG